MSDEQDTIVVPKADDDKKESSPQVADVSNEEKSAEVLISSPAEEAKEDEPTKPEQETSVEAPETAEGGSSEQETVSAVPTEEVKEKRATKTKESPKKKTKGPSKQEAPKRAPKESPRKEKPKTETEQKTALLDSPLVIEGRRQRQSVDRFTATTASTKRKSTTGPGEGSGAALGDIAFVAHELEKKKGGDLKPLHRLCFGRDGKMTEVKKNLKKFNGFPFDASSKEFEKRKLAALKLPSAVLKEFRRLFGINKGGTKKEEEVDIILEFLLEPKDTGKKVPKAKKRKRSKGAIKTNRKTAKKSKGEESGDEEEDDGDEGEEEEEPVPAKKAKKSESPKKSPKKTPQKKTREEVEESDSSESSKDENEQKKESSDEDVRKAVKELLASVDLTKVSMKQMCVSVVERFPNSNLGERKSFLKDLIKAELAEKDA